MNAQGASSVFIPAKMTSVIFSEEWHLTLINESVIQKQYELDILSQITPRKFWEETEDATLL